MHRPTLHRHSFSPSIISHHAACACGAALLAAAAGSTATAGLPHAFESKTLHRAGAPVFLLAPRMPDVAAAAPAIVAVDGDGIVVTLTYSPAGVGVVTLPVTVLPTSNMALRPTIAIADLRPEFPGDEIAVKTGTNVVVLVQPTPGAWEVETVFDGSKLVGLSWGARAGSIDPARPGAELFHIFEGVLDFSTGSVLAPEPGGAWTEALVFQAEVGMDSAIGDSNPALPGNEIVVGTEMGPVYEITPMPGRPGPWPLHMLWNDFDEAPWVLRIADVLPEQPGNEIVYGTRYTRSFLLSAPSGRADGSHEFDVLFAGPEGGSANLNIWDLAVGQLDASTPALELAGVDDNGNVFVVALGDAGWEGDAVLQADEAIYAVVIADLQPQCPGEDIVVAGTSGAVTLLAPRIASATDLDCDGLVGGADLGILLGHWGGSGLGDVDGSGVVDGADLGILLGSWSA